MDWTSFRCECVECRSEPFAAFHNGSGGSATEAELLNLNTTPNSGDDSGSSQTQQFSPNRKHPQNDNVYNNFYTRNITKPSSDQTTL